MWARRTRSDSKDLPLGGLLVRGARPRGAVPRPGISLALVCPRSGIQYHQWSHAQGHTFDDGHTALFQGHMCTHVHLRPQTLMGTNSRVQGLSYYVGTCSWTQGPTRDTVLTHPRVPSVFGIMSICSLCDLTHSPSPSIGRPSPRPPSCLNNRSESHISFPWPLFP